MSKTLELRFESVVGTVRQVSDLKVVGASSGPVLVSVSAGYSELTTWQLDAGAPPKMLSAMLVDVNTSAGLKPQIAVRDNTLLVAGLGPAKFDHYPLLPSGELESSQNLGHLGGSWSAVATLDDTTVALAETDGSQFSLFSWNGDDYAHLRDVNDTATSHADAIAAMAAVNIGSSSFLVTASSSESGLTVWAVDGSSVSPRDSVGPQTGLGIMVPSALEVVQSNDQTYVLVASMPGDGGIGGAISVMELDQFGQLTPTEHVLDSRESRFGQVQSLCTVQYKSLTLVAAGGGDDGVSLLALMPDGRLIHLDSFADNLQSKLDGVTALEMLVTGDKLQIIAAAGNADGFTMLSVDLSAFGTLVMADTESQSISGGAKNDILADGLGMDRLIGGNGADLYVLAADGQSDTIDGFNPNADRIDLTSWPLMHDPDRLDIRSTADGAVITFGNETLRIKSADGGSLDPESVRATIGADIHRVFLPPQVTQSGTAESDHLLGSRGSDALFGEAGNDTLEGGLGDDSLDGGSGIDQAVFNLTSDDVTAVIVEGDEFTVTSSEGTDILTNIEKFVFRNITLDREGLEALSGPVEIRGGPANDRLLATDEDSILTAGGGDDYMRSGDGNDVHMGGEGADTIDAGRGNDNIDAGAGDDAVWGFGGNDSISGGNGNDTLRGGRESDVLIGGEGDDVLRGQRHGDTLYGGLGHDNLKGGGGNDEVYGEGGNDFLKGGTRRDLVDGGSGNDKLLGNLFDDTLIGGQGDDTLKGGGDADVLDGGSGDDFLKGGSGADVFVFDTGHDTDKILDFDPDVDRLLLSLDLAKGATSVHELLRDYAEQTKQGTLLDFGNGNRILLMGLDDMHDLAMAIDFM